MNMSGDGGVAFRGIRRPKVVKIRRFTDGKESDSFNLSHRDVWRREELDVKEDDTNF